MYPHIHGLAVLAGVWLRTTETEITSTQWAHVAWEGLHLSLPALRSHHTAANGVAGRQTLWI